MADMMFVYAFVARTTDEVVVSEYSPFPGNYGATGVESLRRLKASADSRFTLEAEGYNFNFIIKDGFAFMVITERAVARDISYYLLDQLQGEFKAKYEDRGRSAVSHSLDKSFGPRIKYWMEHCEKNPAEISKIANVKSKVEEVKQVMVDNVEKVLDRGERIQCLVDKSDEMRNQASQFEQRGRRLRRQMWCQNMKMKALIAGICLLLLIVIFCSVCFSGGNCLS